MSKDIGNFVRDEFSKRLRIIGWSLKWAGGPWWTVRDENKKETGWHVYGDHDVKLERRNEKEPGCYFALQECDVHMVDGSCVGVSPRDYENIFILFNNYKMTQEETAAAEYKFDELGPWPSYEALEWREVADSESLIKSLRGTMEKRNREIRDLKKRLAAAETKEEK